MKIQTIRPILGIISSLAVAVLCLNCGGTTTERGADNVERSAQGTTTIRYNLPAQCEDNEIEEISFALAQTANKPSNMIHEFSVTYSYPDTSTRTQAFKYLEARGEDYVFDPSYDEWNKLTVARMADTNPSFFASKSYRADAITMVEHGYWTRPTHDESNQHDTHATSSLHPTNGLMVYKFRPANPGDITAISIAAAGLDVGVFKSEPQIFSRCIEEIDVKRNLRYGVKFYDKDAFLELDDVILDYNKNQVPFLQLGEIRNGSPTGICRGKATSSSLDLRLSKMRGTRHPGEIRVNAHMIPATSSPDGTILVPVQTAINSSTLKKQFTLLEGNQVSYDIDIPVGSPQMIRFNIKSEIETDWFSFQAFNREFHIPRGPKSVQPNLSYFQNNPNNPGVQLDEALLTCLHPHVRGTFDSKNETQSPATGTNVVDSPTSASSAQSEAAQDVTLSRTECTHAKRAEDGHGIMMCEDSQNCIDDISGDPEIKPDHCWCTSGTPRYIYLGTICTYQIIDENPTTTDENSSTDISNTKISAATYTCSPNLNRPTPNHYAQKYAVHGTLLAGDYLIEPVPVVPQDDGRYKIANEEAYVAPPEVVCNPI